MTEVWHVTQLPKLDGIHGVIDKSHGNVELVGCAARPIPLGGLPALCDLVTLPY